MTLKHLTIALGFAGALAVGTAVTASAGPLPTSTATVKNAATGHVTDVRWRGRGRSFGPGIGFGLAAGALVGAAVASQSYGPNYYYGGYDAPVYADPYAYGTAPAYVAPGYYGNGYGYGQCFTNEGYGRRRPCDAN